MLRNTTLPPEENRNPEHGFTLTEILVVIIIIGILAAIAIPIYLNQQREANAAALKHDMRSMAASVHTFYTSHDDRENYDLEELNGWTVVARESADAKFSGDAPGSKRPTTYPEGFPPIPLSSGVAIGVAENSNGGREAGEFCIVGNAENSRYEVKDPNGAYGDRLWDSLFYDSSAGGILEPDQLTEDGACGSHKKRLT